MAKTITEIILRKLKWLEKAKELKLNTLVETQICGEIASKLGEYMNQKLAKMGDEPFDEKELDSLEALNSVHQSLTIQLIMLKKELEGDCDSATIWLYGEKEQRKQAERTLEKMMRKVLEVRTLMGEVEKHLEAIEPAQL